MALPSLIFTALVHRHQNRKLIPPLPATPGARNPFSKYFALNRLSAPPKLGCAKRKIVFKHRGNVCPRSEEATAEEFSLQPIRGYSNQGGERFARRSKPRESMTLLILFLPLNQGRIRARIHLAQLRVWTMAAPAFAAVAASQKIASGENDRRPFGVIVLAFYQLGIAVCAGRCFGRAHVGTKSQNQNDSLKTISPKENSTGRAKVGPSKTKV